MRLESDKHLVNRHHSVESTGVSAGLAAFIANYRVQDQAFITIASRSRRCLIPSKAESSVELAEAERLGEDLRLPAWR